MNTVVWHVITPAVLWRRLILCTVQRSKATIIPSTSPFFLPPEPARTHNHSFLLLSEVPTERAITSAGGEGFMMHHSGQPPSPNTKQNISVKLNAFVSVVLWYKESGHSQLEVIINRCRRKVQQLAGEDDLPGNTVWQ